MLDGKKKGGWLAITFCLKNSDLGGYLQWQRAPSSVTIGQSNKARYAIPREMCRSLASKTNVWIALLWRQSAPRNWVYSSQLCLWCWSNCWTTFKISVLGFHSVAYNMIGMIQRFKLRGKISSVSLVCYPFYQSFANLLLKNTNGANDSGTDWKRSLHKKLQFLKTLQFTLLCIACHLKGQNKGM